MANIEQVQQNQHIDTVNICANHSMFALAKINRSKISLANTLLM